jgi:hypothetical protein
VRHFSQKKPLVPLAQCKERWRRCPRWQRLFMTCLFLPSAATATVAAVFYIDMHRQDEKSLPTQVFPAPQIGQRYLFVAPHCDDETLAVGGVIAEARQSNIPVSVAFLTNGDGFRVAASDSLHEVNPTPADFVRFGELRQEPSLLLRLPRPWLAITLGEVLGGEEQLPVGLHAHA